MLFIQLLFNILICIISYTSLNAVPKCNIISLLEPITHTHRPPPTQPNALQTYQEQLDKVITNAEKLLSAEQPTKKSVVIIDIDDTALDLKNPSGRKTLLWNNVSFAFSHPNYGILALYEYLIDRNFKIIFLTARLDKSHKDSPTDDFYQATAENLFFAGYKTYEKLICMTHDDRRQHKTSVWKEKMRTKLVQFDQYDIVATIDDDPDNLLGEFVGYGIEIPSRPERIQTAKKEDPINDPNPSIDTIQRPTLSLQEYQALLTQKITEAETFFQTIEPEEQSLVIFDVDGVALCHNKIMLASAELNNNSTLPYFYAIPEVLKLYKSLIERGFHVVFLTDRLTKSYDWSLDDDIYAATKENLTLAGYTEFDKLIAITRKENSAEPACFLKEAARLKLTSDYKIVATLDDIPENLMGECTGKAIELPWIYNRILKSDYVARNCHPTQHKKVKITPLHKRVNRNVK